jgi:hypothetical protein
MIEIAMQRSGARLVPVDQFSTEDLLRIPPDRDVLVRVSSPRNMKLMRFMWALADKVADACDGLHDKDDAMDMLKIKARHVKYIADPRTGAMQIVPKSLAKTDGAALSRLANRMVYIVCSEIVPSLDESALRAEILAMIAGPDQSSAPADAGADQVARTAPLHSSSDAPQVSETKPAPAEAAPPSLTGAGTSQSSASGTAAAEERQVTEPGASALHGSAGLPEGWRIEYAKALSEAKASRYLKGSAEKFWSQHGGWTAHKSAPHGAIAQAIFDAFANHFSDSEVRNIPATS